MVLSESSYLTNKKVNSYRQSVFKCYTEYSFYKKDEQYRQDNQQCVEKPAIGPQTIQWVLVSWKQAKGLYFRLV